MFDRFTERARKVMTLARQEAQKLRNDYIGTEHILLGLVKEGSGVAAQVLKNLDVDLGKVRAEVERLAEEGEHPSSGSQLPFTPRAKRVLELALVEAQGLGHNYIGTEHLLLGLIREKDGPAAHVLGILGVRTEAVREEVIEILGADADTGPPPVAAAAPGGPGGVRGLLRRWTKGRDGGGAEPTAEGPGSGSGDSALFDRFTERARKVMTLARQEAQKLNNDYIGTEHILVGLVQEGNGVAAQVLKNLDVSLFKVRAELERLVEPEGGPAPGLRLSFTPRARRVLDFSREEARNLGHNFVGTEHLLLGLLRESDGPSAHALQYLGATPEKVREEVVKMLGAESEPRTLPASGGDVGVPGGLRGTMRRWNAGRGETGSKSPAGGSVSGSGESAGFDRYTDGARRVLTRARMEAVTLRNDYIGTEHILLGLAQEEAGVAAQVLKNLGIDLPGVRAEVERIVEQGKEPVTSRQLPFTPRAKRVLEQAQEASSCLDDDCIGPEHLLLGLITESDGPAAHVLGNLGVWPEAVREEVVRLLGAEDGPDSAAGAAESPPATGGVRGLLRRWTGKRGREGATVPSEGPKSGSGELPSLERFSDGARRVLRLAGREAVNLKSDCIGTSHILLGLLQEDAGIVVQMLKNLDIDMSRVRAEVERIVEQGTERVTTLPFTPRAKRVLELALEAARALGADSGGPEHILLGLIAEKDGPAAHVLKNLGVRQEAVLKELEKRREPEGLAGAGSGARPVPPAAPSEFGEGRGEGGADAAFPLSPAGRKVLMWAVEEAEALGHARLEPGHILLGLLDGCEGEDAALLQELGLRAEEARGRVVARLRRGGAGPWKEEGGEAGAPPP
ncbi:MAG: hypothetical protein HUU06_02075 [Planctomycetaceae bacterium]|nr:hypothetical protein [Planctomycetaceae bacterium]